MDEQKIRSNEEWDDIIANLKARYHVLKNQIKSTEVKRRGFYYEIKRAVPPTTERDCPH